MAAARTVLAPAWRKSLRWTLVLSGFALFVMLELWLAQEIVALRWWFALGFFIAVISAAFVLSKPMVALVFWLTLSPIVSKLFRLDWGSGLPAITFDRVVIYFLAFTLCVKALANRTPPARLRLGEWLLLAFPVFIVLSGPFFPSESTTTFVLSVMVRGGDLCILYFVAKACVTKKEHVAWVLVALVLVGFYSAAMAYYDHFTGGMSLVALIGIRAGLIYGDVGGRAAGPFLLPMVLGMFLGLAILLAYHQALWSSNNKVKLLFYASIPIMLAGWYWTYMRGGYLLLLACVFLMPVMAAKSRKGYAVLLACFLAVAVVVVPISMRNKALRYRFTTYKTVQGRVVSGAALVNLIKHNPWFGVGVGNSDEEMAKYATSTAGVPGLYIWQGIGNPDKRYRLPIHTTSHSTYLTVLGDHGVFGGAIFVGCFAAFFVHVWRIRTRLLPKGALGRDFPALVAAIIIGYSLCTNTARIEGGEYISYVIWILIASVVRMADLQVRETEDVAGECQPGIAASSRSNRSRSGAQN